MRTNQNTYIKENNAMFENLEKYTSPEIWDDMMYMYSKNDIDFYKHYHTRQYISIDSKGNFYAYRGEKPVKIKAQEAVQFAKKWAKEFPNEYIN